MGYFSFPNFRGYDADLGWLIKTVKQLVECCETITEWKEQHEQEYQALKTLYDQIISGNFPESVKEAFAAWMEENALDLVGELVKMVIFGLTDDGRLVAYIPDSWDDLFFNTTGYDILPDYEYGHLTISY